MNNEIVHDANIDTPLFGIITSKRIIRLNISLNQGGLAVVETESYLTKDGEEVITNEFARLKESHTFVPTKMFDDMLSELEEQAKVRFHTNNPDALKMDIYSKYTNYYREYYKDQAPFLKL
jgi:hypothetical protein